MRLLPIQFKVTSMRNSIKNVIVTGLFAGLLDGIAAVVFLGKMNAEKVFKFIASGIFGKDAFTGGNKMILYGILLHFLIAVIFAFFYYFVFNRFLSFTDNKFIRGLLYGLLIWTVMNLIVLPISNTPEIQLNLIGAARGILIIVLCVGLPIALLTKDRKNNTA
jgi:hypothetical protein